MPNIHAVARASAALAHMFRSNAESHGLNAALGTAVVVSASPPDIVARDLNAGAVRLNLHLYRVSPSPHFRATGAPTRDASGNSVGAAPIAVELHYLLTAYASTDFQVELLIAYALQVLSENPVLPGSMANDALAVSGTMSTADAATAAARPARLTQSDLGISDLSALWNSFGVPWRTSLTLHVSMTIA